MLIYDNIEVPIIIAVKNAMINSSSRNKNMFSIYSRMAEQQMINETEDNFKTVFKYYKRRRPPPDLKDVVDFHEETPKERFETLSPRLKDYPQSFCNNDIKKLGLNPISNWKCLKLLDIESNGDRLSSGIIMVSNVFTEDGQLLWSLKCMKDYAKNPPNKTNVENLVRTYNYNGKKLTNLQNVVAKPISSYKKIKLGEAQESKQGALILDTKLSESDTNNQKLECDPNLDYDWWANVYNKWYTERLDSTPDVTFTQYERIKTEIDELRWATLGYHHNWDTKKYSDKSVSPFPNDLRDLCKIIISFIGELDQKDIRDEFITGYKPEAAIVNFYPVNSSLGGHTDHSEPNRKAPLLSFSFGLPAIFLCGGPTKETKPTAMVLRSGDILIMTETAREKYHGVPRIFEGEMIQSIFGKEDDKQKILQNQFENVDPELMNDSESTFTKMYLNNHRININVRQVF